MERLTAVRYIAHSDIFHRKTPPTEGRRAAILFVSQFEIGLRRKRVDCKIFGSLSQLWLYLKLCFMIFAAFTLI